MPEGNLRHFCRIGENRQQQTELHPPRHLAVQSYAPTLLSAAQLDDRVIEAMLALPDLDRVAACRLERDYNFTDTETNKYRYQAVFAVTYYE